MHQFAIKAEKGGNLDVLHLGGHLDASGFPRLESAFEQLHASGRHRVILDCKELAYISSVGLGALVQFARKAQEAGGDLKLANVSSRIMEILKVMGFQRILDVQPNVKKAARAFA